VTVSRGISPITATGTDWVGLYRYRPDMPEPNTAFLNWTYVKGCYTQMPPPPPAVTNGTCTFVLAASLQGVRQNPAPVTAPFATASS
jgi:hypothetical protein